MHAASQHNKLTLCESVVGQHVAMGHPDSLKKASFGTGLDDSVRNGDYASFPQRVKCAGRWIWRPIN